MVAKHKPTAGTTNRRPLVMVLDTAAGAAQLHYTSDTTPGFRRRRAGRGFVYLTPDDRPILELATLRRIKALVIPPTYTDVWICPDPHGHLQATGRDAKGRKQYRYHAHWRQARDTLKYDRMIAFGRALPRLRQQVDTDVALPGLSRRKVLAVVVRLLETSLIRVGNDCYRRQNRSYGLTTLRDRHAIIIGTTVRFEFRGKGGQSHSVAVNDRRLARVIRRLQDLPGQELFQYLDDDGRRQTVDSADVNAYLRAVGGDGLTAKDFRTWSSTLQAARLLRQSEPADSDGHRQRSLAHAIRQVAKALGNTPTVCRKYYVHPAVIAAYLAGNLTSIEAADSSMTMADPYALTTEEQTLIDLVSQSASRTTVVPGPEPGQRRPQ